MPTVGAAAAAAALIAAAARKRRYCAAFADDPWCAPAWEFTSGEMLFGILFIAGVIIVACFVAMCLFDRKRRG